MRLSRIFRSLLEGKQVGILYHFTGLDRLADILSENQIGHLHGGWISLTRNPNFYKQMPPEASTPRSRHGVEVECCLVIDGDKLSNKYKLQPFNWFGRYGNPKSDQAKGFKGYMTKGEAGPNQDESEERMKGPLKDLRKYLIEVRVFSSKVDDWDLAVSRLIPSERRGDREHAKTLIQQKYPGIEFKWM